MTENGNKAIYDFYYDTLQFCGCGSPEEALEFLRDVLRAISGRSDEGRLREAVEKENTLLPPDSPLANFFRYWLDSKGWTEHGMNISGAWLTKEGEEVLALLESAPDFEDAMNP